MAVKIIQVSAIGHVGVRVREVFNTWDSNRKRSDSNAHLTPPPTVAGVDSKFCMFSFPTFMYLILKS